MKEGEFLGMVMLCKLASAMKVKELCVGAYFKTKHSLDLSYTAIDTRFVYYYTWLCCSSKSILFLFDLSVLTCKLITVPFVRFRIRWILGFDPAKMVGAKAYDYFHPEDLLATASCHTNCELLDTIHKNY